MNKKVRALRGATKEETQKLLDHIESGASLWGQLGRIERKLDGMYWVLVERMINEMAIELLRHVEFIKRKPTIKIEDAKDALRKIYSKYQGKHEKNVRTL